MDRRMKRRRAIADASRTLMIAGAGSGILACAGCMRGDGVSQRPGDGDLGKLCMKNALRMGHCAPSVMQTILESSGRDGEWLIRLVAGMPGGIGNTGYECGGVSSPLISLGLRYGFEQLHEGIPLVIYKGHDYLRRFHRSNNTLYCGEIQERGMMSCIRAMRNAPAMHAETVRHDCGDAIAAESRRPIASIHAHFRRRSFHCAGSVFENLRGILRVDRELLSGASVFIGGTLFRGMTCGAFTAGVMALGAALGEIENSRIRVLRMIALMMVGGDAMKDSINKFNRAINTGHRLSEWFSGEFGSTQCREITGCDFSTEEGVRCYRGDNRIGRCRAISEGVSRRVREMLPGNTGLRGA